MGGTVSIGFNSFWGETVCSSNTADLFVEPHSCHGEEMCCDIMPDATVASKSCIGRFFDVSILWVFWKLDTHHVWVNFLAEIFMEVSLLEAILAGVKLTATLLQEQPLLEIFLVLVMMFVTLSGSMLEVLPLATRPVFEILLVMQSMDTGFVISTVDIFLWMSSPALETRPAFKSN